MPADAGSPWAPVLKRVTEDSVALLGKYGIRLRTKDGIHGQTTWSVPKSIPNALVLGIRYTKKDGTPTEDLFLFRKGMPIEKRRKEIEKLLPEYRWTHKGPFSKPG